MSASYWLSLCLLILIGTIQQELQAQQRTQDIVELKDGTIITGELLEYTAGKQLSIKLEDGTIQSHQAQQIQKVSKTAVVPAMHPDTVARHLPKKGIHSNLAFSLFGAIPPDMGLQIDYTLWYQMNHWLALGGGMGITGSARWVSIPIYASLRTYFAKASGTGFCELNIGYLQTLGQGLSFAPSQVRSERFYGGLYLRPAIGYRFPAKLKTHVGIDLGCGIRHFRWGFQQLEPFPNTEPYQEEVVTIFSPSIRFNILF